MKLFSALLFIPIITFIGEGVKADLWIDGYQRKDGTPVRGHWRTEPNDSIYDNYSYPGNFNPNNPGNFNPNNGSSGNKSLPSCRNGIVIAGICG